MGHNTKGFLISSAIFAGLTNVTDRQTDHATRSVTIDRIYVRSTAMRPNNSNNPTYSAPECRKTSVVAFYIHDQTAAVVDLLT